MVSKNSPSVEDSGSTKDGLHSNELLKHYSLRDPMQAYELAGEIASSYGDSQHIRIGLNELILNAIEHGNLEIGFEQKSALLKSGEYLDVLADRLHDEKFAERQVNIYVAELSDRVTFTIVDDGPGFDPSPYLTFDDARKALQHGRGIAIACLSCFDEVSFSKKGNAVTCVASFVN